jgi:phage baseplate assembly protein W
LNIHGSCLSFPVRVDSRGTLATVSDPQEMAEQFLQDLIETYLYERVMIPDYGMRDRTFAVMGAGFTVQLAADLEEQVKDFLPIINLFKVQSGVLMNIGFVAGFTTDQHRAAISIDFTVRGDNTPRNLVFPTWQLLEGVHST